MRVDKEEIRANITHNETPRLGQTKKEKAFMALRKALNMMMPMYMCTMLMCMPSHANFRKCFLPPEG